MFGNKNVRKKKKKREEDASLNDNSKSGPNNQLTSFTSPSGTNNQKANQLIDIYGNKENEVVLSPLSLSMTQTQYTKYDNQSRILSQQSGTAGAEFSTTSNVYFSPGSNAADINKRSQEARQLKEIVDSAKLSHQKLLEEMQLYKGQLPATIVQQIEAIGKTLNG